MRDKAPRPDPTPAARSAARRAQDAATRRRWITLGEVLAVVAVCISALTLWNSWSERRGTDAAKSSDARQASVQAATLVLVSTRAGDQKLTLRPASAEQSIQSQTIAFPAALGIAPVDTTGDSRVEAGWFDHALKNARGASHLPAESRGDERLPIAITTRFLVDGAAHQDVAIYDIGYGISGHWFGGRTIVLRGISLVGHVGAAAAPTRLSARWSRLLAHQA